MQLRAALITFLGASAALGVTQAKAAFPGEPGRLIYEDQLASGFYTADPDGSDRRQILAALGTRTDDPSISPDGRLVVFSRSLDLWITAADGTGTPRALTTGDQNDQGAVFSPDGKRIVFTRVAEDDLFVIGADGTGERNLTNDGSTAQEYEPAWSPTGDRIVYERGTSGGQGSIYSIATEGGAATNLTPEQPTPPTCDPDFFTHSSDPSWSPDGTRIAFTGPSLCPGGSGPKNYGSDIWIMAADGSGKANITNNDGPSEIEPHWSPDGTRIAVLSDQEEREGPADVFVMNADGGGAAKVLDREVKGGDLDWGPAPARIVPRKLTATAKAGGRGLTVSGRLVLPDPTATCSGRVRVKATLEGGKAIGPKVVSLKASCRYEATLRLPSGAEGKVKIAAAFLGTPAIAPKRAAPGSVRLR